MKAALYLRVSTVEQAEEGYSLPAQDAKLRAYCAAQGYDIAGVYEDAGISGKSIVAREGLQNMLHDAKRNKFAAIIVWKLTRFSRNLSEFYYDLERLQCFVSCDCFSGTLAEFEARVDSVHGDNDHGQQYRKEIKKVKTLFDMEDKE